MANFSFAEWYARMGYHRRGGQRDCAEALGITTRYIRHLLSGRRTNPRQALVTSCRRLELAGEQDQIP